MTQGMEWLLIAWGVVTGILILLFYRSTLTRQEDDQLFIDESSSSRATEQSQLIAKVFPVLSRQSKGLAIGSIALKHRHFKSQTLALLDHAEGIATEEAADIFPDPASLLCSSHRVGRGEG